MGQKVNPLGIRLGITRDWTSKWYAGKKQFPQHVYTDWRVRGFLRYYTIPGLGHVFGSPRTAGGGFFAAWDPLPALDAWVESGQAPSGLVTTDQNAATSGRTRPVCEWPSWPKYKGSGDPNSAASFTCAGPAGAKNDDD